MCLGIPGKILEIDGLVATVDFFGVRKQVRLDIVDTPVAVGDYILNHVGFAIHRIPEEDIGETLALFDELLRTTGDPMGEEAKGELLSARDEPHE